MWSRPLRVTFPVRISSSSSCSSSCRCASSLLYSRSRMSGPSAQLSFRLVSEKPPRGPMPIAFSTQANTTPYPHHHHHPFWNAHRRSVCVCDSGKNNGGRAATSSPTGAGGKASWSRLLPLVRPELPMLAAGGAALLLSSAITMAIPIGSGTPHAP